MTLSGKSTLAKRLAESYRANGFKIIVLDPTCANDWPADFQTANREAFIDVVNKSRRCMLFVDEAGEMIGRYAKEMFFLATRARHLGHISHFITQRPKQINPTVRDNCEKLFLFNVSADSAKELANEFNRPELRGANTLKRGEYFYCPRFGGLKKARVF